MGTASDTLILGTRKGLLLAERNARGWTVKSESHRGIPIPYAMIDPRTGALWASLSHGHWGQKMSRSKDNGGTWEEVPPPKYAESAEFKDGVPATLYYLWVIEPGGKDQPGRLYAGTAPGGLFQSDDDGDTFQLVESLWNHPSRKDQWFGGGLDQPGIHSVVVDPRNSKRVLIGISCAGVFETTDDGKTWASRNKGLKATFLPDPDAEIGHDPHFMTASESQPDMLWQQNHCGIFRSRDGAKSWEFVSQPNGPAHFGFAVEVDPKDGNTAWVVPAISDEVRMAIDGALCVCRTEDGGKSWTAFRNGLPQSGCYDVVFRHGLDQSGDRLAFGSTTGNVYVSDDRGESWQPVGNNLPPIYSVRFAPTN